MLRKTRFRPPLLEKKRIGHYSGGNTNGGHPDASPESGMNDNPRPEEKVGAPNTAPK
jgi:hypothetical protein